MTNESIQRSSSCITVLRYAGSQFAICTVHNEIIPKRELSSHVQTCRPSSSSSSSSPQHSGDAANTQVATSVVNDDTSPIMTLQRLFQTEVSKWNYQHSLPLLPSFLQQQQQQKSSIKEDTDERRSVCKLCLAHSNQVSYTKTPSDRLAHLETFHSKIYATFGANIRDLNAQYNNQAIMRRGSDKAREAAKQQLLASLRSIDKEIDRDYFESVRVIKLRDGGGTERGFGDFVWFPTVISQY